MREIYGLESKKKNWLLIYCHLGSAPEPLESLSGLVGTNHPDRVVSLTGIFIQDGIGWD
jgi:hypothetical protein